MQLKGKHFGALKKLVTVGFEIPFFHRKWEPPHPPGPAGTLRPKLNMFSLNFPHLLDLFYSQLSQVFVEMIADE